MIIKQQIHILPKFSHLEYSLSKQVVCFQMEILVYCFRVHSGDSSVNNLHFHVNGTLHSLHCQ